MITIVIHMGLDPTLALYLLQNESVGILLEICWNETEIYRPNDIGGGAAADDQLF